MTSFVLIPGAGGNGYHFDRYDLVVTAVQDMDLATSILYGIGIQVEEPGQEQWKVWRVPHRLRHEELRDRLTRLPCVFADLSRAMSELIEETRHHGAFSFEWLEYRPDH